MLLTGQLHLGAEHDFARPPKNACVFPSCTHTSFVTLLKGIASGGTQPHSHSQQKPAPWKDFSSNLKGKFFWEEHQSYSRHGEATGKLQKYSDYTVVLLFFFNINLLEVKRNSYLSRALPGLGLTLVYVQA